MKDRGIFLDSSRLFEVPTLSLAVVSLRMYPLSLKSRPKAVSSGGLLWHTLQESPV